nr:hypothetical protein [Pseudomonas sp. P818]
MSDKPLKAYAVTERSEAMTVIVFASSGIAARRLGANEHDTEFECIESCRRAPWADRYQNTGKIPAQAWIDNGYSQTCDYCETGIYGDTTKDEDGNEQEPIFEGVHAYCGPGCKAAREQDIAERKASGQSFIAKVQAERPYLTFTLFRADYPWAYNSAEFSFEGAKYGGGVQEKEGGKLEWHVNPEDKPAWDRLIAAQEAA